MALIETLIAVTILALALASFWTLLVDARADLARARALDRADALGARLLLEARRDWPDIAASGQSHGQRWRRECALFNGAQSPRLAMLACVVCIDPSEGAPRIYRTAWAVTRARLRPQ